MATKRMMLCPIYWGDWWVPVRHNAYNWAEVNGQMANVVSGRYMDGLNQYGIGRGAVTRTYVHQIDPPTWGFTDYNTAWLFKLAIDGNLIARPDDFDLDTELPFYCLIVKPGIEHRATKDNLPVEQWPTEPTLGAYHYGFSYDFEDGRKPWSGQACWVKGDAAIGGTIARWVHEMAEAYAGAEIADKCQGQGLELVDGVPVPQYWSNADSACRPEGDEMQSVQRALEDALTGASSPPPGWMRPFHPPR
jgi:hypothetical protein